MPKKTERGDPLEFFNIHSVAKHQKNCRGSLRGKFFFRKKKSRSAEKNEKGESLVSPGMVCYAEKQEKPFWFSSLDQIVHFDAIILCRTFVKLFWSVRVDRKKRVTIIVAFHFMKRRLKKHFGIVGTVIFSFHQFCFRFGSLKAAFGHDRLAYLKFADFQKVPRLLRIVSSNVQLFHEIFFISQTGPLFFDIFR